MNNGEIIVILFTFSGYLVVVFGMLIESWYFGFTGMGLLFLSTAIDRGLIREELSNRNQSDKDVGK